MWGWFRMRRTAASLFLVGCLLVPAVAGAVAPDVAAGVSAASPVSDLPVAAALPLGRELLVRLKDGVPSGSLAPAFRQIGVLRGQAVVGPGPRRLAALDGVVRLELAPGVDPVAAASALSRDPRVDFAEPNRLAAVAALPNDRFVDPARRGTFQRGSWAQPYADLWGLDRISWGQVWRQQARIWPDPARRGGGGVVVAVIDTGVDVSHPDLAPNLWRDDAGNPGVDLVGVSSATLGALAEAGYTIRPDEDYQTPDGDPADRNGHGTHVAGTIGAVARNGEGIAGVAWRARLMPVRAGFDVFKTSDGAHLAFLEEDDIAAAIVWATDHGAHVINLSFGLRGEESRTVALAIDYAVSRGVILVAAAGNEGADAVSTWPAANPKVVSVAATVASDRRIFFSNWGASVDIAAPGSEILSARAEGTAVGGWSGVLDARYTRASGTSMAAPHVAGAIALVRSAWPRLRPAEVVARVLATADPFPDLEAANGRARAAGSGRLNLLRALTASAEPSFAIRSLEVVADTDGDRVPEPGETVRVRIEIRNQWRPVQGVSMRLVAETPQVAVVSGSLPAQPWPSRGSAVLEAELRVSDAVAWGTSGTLHLEVRGAGIAQNVPLPLVLRGPVVKPGWPVAGEREADGVITAPAVGDVEGDGSLEIFALSSRGDAFLRAADGTLLPGWPLSFPGNTEQSSPLARDLDGDGRPELIFVRGRQVHVLDAAGRSLPGWPQVIDGWVSGAPAVGDLDGDGRPEVVVLADDARAFAFDAAGRSLPGWPRKLGGSSNTPPVLVDLDGLPGLEILAGMTDGTLTAVRSDGSIPAGAWPVRLAALGPSTPALADLDGDGAVEIVVASVTGRLYRITRNGRVDGLGKLPGTWFFSSPAVGDLDGDGRPEIAIGSGQFDGSGFLTVVDAAGRLLPGWPVATEVAVTAAPVLADLDGDRRSEVIVPDLGGRLHVWQAAGQTLGGWPYDLQGGTPASPVVADLDGDGTLEIVIGKTSSLRAAGPAPLLEALEYGVVP